VIINGVPVTANEHTFAFPIPNISLPPPCFGRFQLHPANAEGNCPDVSGALTGSATNGGMVWHGDSTASERDDGNDIWGDYPIYSPVDCYTCRSSLGVFIVGPALASG
jgi:hypothetical protein